VSVCVCMSVCVYVYESEPKVNLLLIQNRLKDSKVYDLNLFLYIK